MRDTSNICSCRPALVGKRKRGRPPSNPSCCWRLLSLDRPDLPPPHNISLASRCFHELCYERRDLLPTLSLQTVANALAGALPKLGFRITSRCTRLTLRDDRSTMIEGKIVWDWHDRRDISCLYVKQSDVPHSGAGAFAARALKAGDWIDRYTGTRVKAEVMRALKYERGYILRVGGSYVDARDPNGRLRLSDGTLVNPHTFEQEEWAAIADNPGVAWEGEANLCRFIQHSRKPNAKFEGSDIVCLKPIERDGEVKIDYGKDFWGRRLKKQKKCGVCLEDEVYEQLLWQCNGCNNFCHKGCIHEWLQCTPSSVMPHCPQCRAPLPSEIGNRVEMCRTPGCTYRTFHIGPCETESHCAKLRSEQRARSAQ